MNQYIAKLDLGWEQSWYIVSARNEVDAKVTLLDSIYKRLRVRHKIEQITDLELVTDAPVQLVTSVYHED